MTTTINNPTLSGTISLAAGALISRVVVGSGTPGHATSAGTAYVKDDLEVDGDIYQDADHHIDGGGVTYLEAANAAAASVQEGANVYVRYDTVAEQVEVGQVMELSADGFTNAAGGTGTIRQPETFVYALAALDAAGGILNQVNPFGVNAYVRIVLDVTTVATGACTINAGVAATGVSSDTLLDGLDVNSATGLFSSVDDPGGNGRTYDYIAAGEYITISMATGAAAGLVGNAYVTLQARA